MSLARPALRAVLWSAVALQAVLLVARLLLDLRLLGAGSEPGGYAAVIAESATMGVFPLLGAVILHRQPENRIGWIFCLVNTGLVINVTVRSYVHLGMVAEPGSVPGPEKVVWLYTWPGFVSFALVALLFLLFPDGRFVSPRWRTLGRVTVGTMAVAGVLAAIAPGPVDPSLGLEVTNPLGVGHPVTGPVVYELSTAGYPVGILLLLAAIVSTVQRYRVAVGVERLQLKWFATGAAVWGVLVAAFLPVALTFPDWQFPLWARLVELATHLGAAVFPIAAGMAILRYRLYEIDRIISRTVSYAVLTVLLVGIYVAGVLGLGAAARAVTGGGGGDLVVAASTLVVAAAFGPLRRRIQAVVDQRFNRSRYDALRTVEDFGQRLRDDVDLTVLSGALRATVAATVQPRAVGLWLFPEERT